MPDWQSMEEIQLDTLVYNNFTLVVLGIYFWDLVMTIPFEFNLLRRRIRWRWHMALVETSRAAAIVYIVTNFIVSYSPNTHCTAVTRLLVFSVGLIYWCSTLIFGLRCAAVYAFNRYIVALVALAFTNQFVGVVAITTINNAYYHPETRGCYIDQTTAWLPYILCSQLVIDLTFLILTVIRLRRNGGGGSIAHIIIRDGMYYFIAAVIANAIDLFFYFSDWNQVMRFMFDLACGLIISVTSTRAAIALYTLNPADVRPADGYIWTGRPRSDGKSTVTGASESKLHRHYGAGPGAATTTIGGSPLNRSVDTPAYGHKHSASQHTAVASNHNMNTKSQGGGGAYDDPTQSTSDASTNVAVPASGTALGPGQVPSRSGSDVPSSIGGTHDAGTTSHPHTTVDMGRAH